MTNFSKNDTHFMSLALQLARKGRYGVASNPMVGPVNTAMPFPLTKGLGSSVAITTSLTLASMIA
jgi:hypothetical protein